MSYTKYQVAELIFKTWRDVVMECDTSTSPTDELDYLKENILKEYDLTNEDIKKIFDDANYPFYWDIEDDEIKNCDADGGEVWDDEAEDGVPVHLTIPPESLCGKFITENNPTADEIIQFLAHGTPVKR